MTYQPPFKLTNTLVSRVAEIIELVANWNAHNPQSLVPQLRRGNRIKTVQASLAIEQNTLTVEQVTALLDGKRVLGRPQEIQEVHNAFAAYDALAGFDSGSVDDLLTAHGLLLKGLSDDAGSFRVGGVGIYQDKQLVHMAPPAKQVPRLIHDLQHWLAATDAHPLIASCAFHYELEFIHPFSDGNGRIGRLWQTLILSRWHPLLAYLPMETVIKSRQDDYYRLLGEADASSDCGPFMVFLLDAISEALNESLASEALPSAAKTPVETPVEKQLKTPEQILLVLAEHPQWTLAEVAQSLGKSVSAIERAATKLKQQGRLQRVGARKGGSWLVVSEPVNNKQGNNQ
ncbi:MAG: Fic family protein [Endozoicomonadaceae bacterium]|nr:Fic family protein [Endozoicomonadaceae bacterium]